MKEQLKSVYEPFLASLKKLPDHTLGQLSCPLFMHPFKDYSIAKYKVLYVGKETYDWVGYLRDYKKLQVDDLMKKYKEFEFGKDYHGKNSPFWRFIRNCHTVLNGEHCANGFLWTNFSKCDSNRTTPSQALQEDTRMGFDLIKEEINIVKPDIVIFLTGWSYERQFQRVFDPLKYDTMDENYLYRCIHKSLPYHTYMTMHPNALSFRKRFDDVMDRILKEVAA